MPRMSLFGGDKSEPEENAAIKIQCQVRKRQAKKSLEEKREGPGVASRIWSETKGVMRQRILELDRLKGIYAEKAHQVAREKAELLKAAAVDKKQALRKEIEGLAEKRVVLGVRRCKTVAVDAATDPFMPLFLQKWTETVVSASWPDVEEEILCAVMSAVRKKPAFIPGPPPSTCPGQARAAVRYFLFPYDRSLWRQLHSPLFVLYKLVCLTPLFGVPQAVYFFHLLVIDREDVYQLIQYILAFKALLFLTMGVIGSAVASIQFYICFQDISGQRETPVCSKTAPKEKLFVLGLIALQVVMVWYAFWCLKTAKSKGGRCYLDKKAEAAEEMEGEEMDQRESEQKGANPRARSGTIIDYEEREAITRERLLLWLYYDMGCFVLCLGLLLLAAFYGPNDTNSRVTSEGWDNWRFESALYMVKCLYGLLSFPFVFLRLPVISSLLTHARHTAYTRSGECVPFIGNCTEAADPSPVPESEDQSWAKRLSRPDEADNPRS